MRTKSLLFTAALSAIGFSGAVGQVYSQNVVGYISIVAPKGLSIIANQLDNKTGNILKDVIPALPNGSFVHFYKNGGYVSIDYFDGYGVGGDVEKLEPGSAAFLAIPNDATDAGRKITFVGEVLQGAASNGSIPNGLSFISSKVPLAGKVTTDLKLPAGSALNGSFLYKYDNSIGNYVTSDLFDGWTAEPSLAIGEGAFFLNASGAAQPWDQNFVVQ